MRINPDVLRKLAQDAVIQRAGADRSIVAAYLQGSLLGGSPLLGNAADIDLVFVHNQSVGVEREIVYLSDEVHLDIAHHETKLYRQPRDLRLHPWLGPSLYSAKILYDPQHFLDFAQASVRGQFDRPDHVAGRARRQAEHARQIWMDFHLSPSQPGPSEMGKYLRAVEHAANAVAGISGPPLTERRFLLDFLPRAEALQRPGLYAGLLGLLGASAVEADTLRGWLPEWEIAYKAVDANDAPPRLHPCRWMYYERGVRAILQSERPHNALWPMWRTWTLAVRVLPAGHPALTAWQSAGKTLGLLGDGFLERIEALDSYLDLIEETLETWEQENGV